MFSKKSNAILNFFLFFAITAWPFLNFYASKTNFQLIWFKSFFCLFLIFFGIFFLFFELIRKFFKFSRERMLVLYAVFIMFFFSSRACWEYLIKYTFFGNLPYRLFFYLSIIFIFSFACYKLSKSVAFQRAVSMFVFIIFSFSLAEFSIILFNKENQFFSQSSQSIIPLPSFVFKDKPNIYFLLVDAYTRADILKSNTNFDNKDFIEFLKAKGFIVADKSYSNYSVTRQSLSATFKMDYIQKNDVNQNDVLSPDKEVFRILRSNDYKILLLPGYYSFLSGRNIADITISYGNLINLLTHNIQFLRNNILYIFEGLIRPFLFFDINHVKEIFSQNVVGSKFVFMHYLTLHDAVYPKNCKIESKLIFRSISLLPYHHHLSCMNSFVKESINEIMKNDPNSIIIIQGDHGPMEWRPEGESPTNFKNFENMFSILSAVYIPGLDKKSEIAKYLSNSPTPVNNFRTIFSYLAKSPVKLLPHRHFGYEYNELTGVGSQNSDR